VKQFFQMSPRGEKADLFLLELAAATEYPIISDDTFQEYGGVANGVIAYESTRLAVHNFQVIAGTVVIPDLHIRFRFAKNHASLDGIADTLAALEAKGEAEDAMAVSPAPGDPPIAIDDTIRRAIRAVIEAYVDGGSKPLAELGKPLAGYKQAFIAQSGVGKTGRRVWFGFPTLSDFIRATYPDYRIEGGTIGGA